jgi:hypothetical protein
MISEPALFTHIKRKRSYKKDWRIAVFRIAERKMPKSAWLAQRKLLKLKIIHSVHWNFPNSKLSALPSAPAVLSFA